MLRNIFIVLVVGILLTLLFLAVKVDVEIYTNRETGKTIYCATGSLTDPPFRHDGAGTIAKGKESYC